jgi:hypothetical protein
MSKTNKKTQNNQRKGANTKSMKNKQKNNPPQQRKARSPKQASVAAAYATRSEGKAPKIQASRDSCNIKHREFIGNVSGSTLFQLALSLSVNPGLAATFPWLSIMASAWEQYKFKKLRFVFLTRTGSNTPGSVIMSPDYDSADAAPASEQIMTTYEGTVEDAPWKDNAISLKTHVMSSAAGSRKFVRSSALSANQDIKLYDVANFFVATVDGTALPWGKLWVEYDIDFFVPQLPPSGIITNIGGTVFGGGTKTPSNPLGDAAGVDPQSGGFSVDANSNITFNQSGTYLVQLTAVGAVAITDLILIDVVGTLPSLLNFIVLSAAGNTAAKTYQVTVAGPGSTFHVATVSTDPGNTRVNIAIVPPNSLN